MCLPGFFLAALISIFCGATDRNMDALKAQNSDDQSFRDWYGDMHIPKSLLHLDSIQHQDSGKVAFFYLDNWEHWQILDSLFEARSAIKLSNLLFSTFCSMEKIQPSFGALIVRGSDVLIRVDFRDDSIYSGAHFSQSTSLFNGRPDLNEIKFPPIKKKVKANRVLK